MNKFFNYLANYFEPRPENSKKQGFQPNGYIKLIRFLFKWIIRLLRIDGGGRISNEFIQSINPRYKLKYRDKEFLYKTGHGRLYWRAKYGLKEEKMLLDWMDTFDSKNDCFLDIGANIGTYSLYAAKNSIRTIACEVDLINASILYENLFINNLEDRVIVLPFALNNITTISDLHLKDVSPGDALHSINKPSYMLSNLKLSRTIKCLSFTLDELLERFGNSLVPTKIKIDTDGNELQIIEGAKKTLSKIDSIYIELDPKNTEHAKVSEILNSLGFKITARESGNREWTEVSNYLFLK